MQTEFYGDLELAKIIERVSAEDDAAYVDAMKELYPEQAFENFSFEGGVACFVGASPFSSVHGFGSYPESHDEGLLDKIEDFYNSKNIQSTISVASAIDPRAIRLIYAKQFGVVSYRNVYIYTRDMAPKDFPSITIKEVNSENDLQLWLQLVSDGFAGKKLEAPDAISLGQSVKKGNLFYIGFYNGEPAAASALYINGEVARLGGMGTLVEYRGKGFQQAMILHRVEEAKKRSLKYIFSDTQPGNNSQRNLERCGFKLAYVRSIMRQCR